jgi:hypothetical protein
LLPIAYIQALNPPTGITPQAAAPKPASAIAAQSAAETTQFVPFAIGGEQ